MQTATTTQPSVHFAAPFNPSAVPRLRLAAAAPSAGRRASVTSSSRGAARPLPVISPRFRGSAITPDFIFISLLPFSLLFSFLIFYIPSEFLSFFFFHDIFLFFLFLLQRKETRNLEYSTFSFSRCDPRGEFLFVKFLLDFYFFDFRCFAPSHVFNPELYN